MPFTENPRTKPQVLAYEALSNYLEEHENEVIEIEILPPAIEPPNGILLHEGLNLGVPKKTLTLAFLEGRQLFFREMYDDSSHTTALRATKVMLLFDPEHITAANFRKRLLLENKSKTHDPARYRRALQQELCFLNSILTSPLHRQSKSPTLWHHRLWLLSLIVPCEIKNATTDQIATFWLAELAAVCKAGEQHPKNYYAWQYARRIMPRIESPNINDEFARCTRDWCFKHPSDISGWSFLGFQLSRLHFLSQRQGLMRDILRYTTRLQSNQESLWVFIRTNLAQQGLVGSSIEFDEILQTYKSEVQRIQADPAIVERVDQALRWIDANKNASA